VRLRDAEPDAEMTGTPKAAVIPAGSPDRVKVITESKPPDTATVIEVLAVLDFAPRVTVTDVGEAEIVKAAGAVTVRLTVVVRVRPPAIPVTVTV
jgi:hypothetical protein